MKKIISVLALSFLLLSCSNEMEETSQKNQSFNLKETVKEKYDGKIFKFKDNEDFINFYKNLTNLSSNEFQDYLKIKGDNNSSQFENLSNEEEVLANEDSNKSMTETKICKDLIVSEFLSSIFNNENNIKIGNQIVELNEKGELVTNTNGNSKVIGYIQNDKVSENNETFFRHNANYAKSWTKTSGSKRVTLKIFNESLYINNALTSSNLFYTVHQQYKSCSFWRCTWKDDNISASLYPNLSLTGHNCGTVTYTGTNDYELTGLSRFTKKIAEVDFVSIVCSTTIYITGSFYYERTGYNTTFTNLTYDYNPF